MKVPVISFVTILIRFVQAVRRSWRDLEFRGPFGFVVTLLTRTLFYSRMEG